MEQNKSNKLEWNKDVEDSLNQVLVAIGLNKYQSKRILYEINTSITWNEDNSDFVDTDEVVFDGDADEDTCLSCLRLMESGSHFVSDLKDKGMWHLSPHANCRHNYTFDNHLSIQKRKRINSLIQKKIKL